MCVERFCVCAQLESRHLRVTAVFALQGVTLTDLQEAEKTMKTENKGKEKTKEEEEKEGKQKKAEEGVRKVEFNPNICICSALREINQSVILKVKGQVCHFFDVIVLSKTKQLN